MFDVYDTLLDTSPLQLKVNNLMNSRHGYRIWFELFMQYCFVDNCTFQFNSFTDIGSATLQMAAKSFNRSVDKFDIKNTLTLLAHLPLQDNVQEGLSHLSESGCIIAALTNVTQTMVSERMEKTGLISYFEKVLSAEAVKKYKPCIEVYQWAADSMQCNCIEILFVSSHGWDIAGAANAGMQTAYINRSNEMIYPLSPRPHIVTASVEELAEFMSSL